MNNFRGLDEGTTHMTSNIRTSGHDSITHAAAYAEDSFQSPQMYAYGSLG
jgi:hypothetical protein